MDDQELIQARLREIMLKSESGQEQLQKLLHRQHYDFAHKAVPYLIWERFDELIQAFETDSAQEWINEIWSDFGDAPLKNFSVPVYPICEFEKFSAEIGLIYFIMPAPRTTGEVVYSSAVFLMDKEPCSTWLRRYFTLELGAYFPEYNDPAHWTLAEWDWEPARHCNNKHSNYGEFPLVPTLSNFLSEIADVAKKGWY
jgi:hypothetical protein